MKSLNYWLLARLPRVIVIILYCLGIAVIGIASTSFVLFATAKLIKAIENTGTLGIIAAIVVLSFCIVIIGFWSEVDRMLPKREKKNDE